MLSKKTKGRACRGSCNTLIVLRVSLRSLCHGLTRHRCKHMQARSFHGYLASPLSVVTRTRFVTSLELKIRRNIPGVGLPWPACWSRSVHAASLARCKCRGCTVSQPDPSNEDACISGFWEERSARRTYDGRNDRRSRRGGRQGVSAAEQFTGQTGE